MRAPGPKHFIHGAIFLLANRLQAVGDQVTRDITSKQWFTLLAVSQWPGTPRVTDVAAELGSSRQNSAKLLEQLEQKGYVQLFESPSDHRSRGVRLTDKARAQMPLISAEGEKFIQRLFAGIPDEDIETAGRVLRTVFENAAAMKQGEILERRNGMGQPAEGVAGAVVADQSLDVDAVAGATFSSKTIL